MYFIFVSLMELSHEICCMFFVLKIKSAHLEKALMFKKSFLRLVYFIFHQQVLFFLFQNALEFHKYFPNPSFYCIVFLTAFHKLDKT
jgi:hypothetical protein